MVCIMVMGSQCSCSISVWPEDSSWPRSLWNQAKGTNVHSDCNHGLWGIVCLWDYFRNKGAQNCHEGVMLSKPQPQAESNEKIFRGPGCRLWAGEPVISAWLTQIYFLKLHKYHEGFLFLIWSPMWPIQSILSTSLTLFTTPAVMKCSKAPLIGFRFVKLCLPNSMLGCYQADACPGVVHAVTTG